MTRIEVCRDWVRSPLLVVSRQSPTSSGKRSEALSYSPNL